MEQLKGCDGVTKAFVLATMKDKAEGYMPRYFQHQMVVGLQTIATDAVTTCPTYTKLLEVLDSDDFDAEKKIKQILALLSTTNEESEWKSPYDSSSRTTYRGRQIPSNISSIRLSQRGRRFARLQMRTWFTLWKQSTPSIFPTKFSSIYPHNFSARLYWVKVGQVDIDDVVQDQYINVIVMDCSLFSPFAIQLSPSSSSTTRIKSSASLVAVTHVLAEAGIVCMDCSKHLVLE